MDCHNYDSYKWFCQCEEKEIIQPLVSHDKQYSAKPDIADTAFNGPEVKKYLLLTEEVPSTPEAQEAW